MTIKDADISGNGSGFNITTSGSITLQDLIIDNCDLTAAGNLGGGVYVGSTSTVTVDRCIFKNNNSSNTSTSYGTCVYTLGTTTVQNCLLYDNSVLYTGDPSTGHIHTKTGTLNVKNCTITENTDASVSYNYDGDVYVESGIANITNSILYNNGGDDNVFRYGGTASISYSLYDDGVGGTVTTTTGNIVNTDADPIFMDVTTDDFRISAISPCREKGTNTSVPTVDLNESTRGSSGTNTGSSYDMGCYEQSCVSGIYYVNDNSTTGDVWVSAVGNNSNAGTTIAPYLTLGAALKNCGCAGNTIRVDAGSYSEDNFIVSTDATTGGLSIVGASNLLTIFDGDVDAVTTERFMTINVDADNISISDMTIKDADISG
ncbi:MAG: hypothetical protein ACOVOV_16280, partial [Dolichospermum sp.]